MAGGLRREGGRSSAPGVFSVSGSLRGIKGPPWRRAVTTLELRRFGPGEDLSALGRFPDLEGLELHRANGVDLSPLAELRLKSLIVKDASGLDLAPISDLAPLERLALANIDGCRFPPNGLPSTLRTLAIANDDPEFTGAPVKHAIETIEWHRLDGLVALGLRVGGQHDMAPIEVDLGFLRHLARLEHLELAAGVHHAGPLPSPLEPPFYGLSRHLSFCRIDAWDPDPLRAALAAHLGIDASGAESGLAVHQRAGLGAAPQPAAGGFDDVPVAGPGEPYDTEFDWRAAPLLPQEDPAPVRRGEPDSQPASPPRPRGGRHRHRAADSV